MREKPLRLSKQSDGELYRLIYRPEYGTPLLIRIEKKGDITIIETKQSGVVATGAAIITRRNLSSAEWGRFKGLLEKMDFWNIVHDPKNVTYDMGDDILEASVGDRYHYLFLGDMLDNHAFFELRNWLVAQAHERGFVESGGVELSADNTGIISGAGNPSGTSSKHAKNNQP